VTTQTNIIVQEWLHHFQQKKFHFKIRNLRRYGNETLQNNIIFIFVEIVDYDANGES
jgi:hypothetical protein